MHLWTNEFVTWDSCVHDQCLTRDPLVYVCNYKWLLTYIPRLQHVILQYTIAVATAGKMRRRQHVIRSVGIHLYVVRYGTVRADDSDAKDTWPIGVTHIVYHFHAYDVK